MKKSFKKAYVAIPLALLLVAIFAASAIFVTSADAASAPWQGITNFRMSHLPQCGLQPRHTTMPRSMSTMLWNTMDLSIFMTRHGAASLVPAPMFRTMIRNLAKSPARMAV